jgi:hypothetical protein
MFVVGDFVRCNTSKYIEYGVKKKDVMYLAGDMMVLVKEEDPYGYRKLFIGAKVEDGRVNTTDKGLSVDASNFTKLSDVAIKKLKAQLEADYTPKES